MSYMTLPIIARTENLLISLILSQNLRSSHERSRCSLMYIPSYSLLSQCLYYSSVYETLVFIESSSLCFCSSYIIFPSAPSYILRVTSTSSLASSFIDFKLSSDYLFNEKSLDTCLTFPDIQYEFCSLILLYESAYNLIFLYFRNTPIQINEVNYLPISFQKMPHFCYVAPNVSSLNNIYEVFHSVV